MRSLLCCLLPVLASYLYASSQTDPFGFAFRDVSGHRIWVFIEGFQESTQKVSGTNIVFSLRMGFHPQDPPPGAPPWLNPWKTEKVTLQSAPPETELQIGGNAIPPPPNSNNSIVWELDKTYQVVFASTQFVPDTIVNIKLKARFRGEHLDGSSISYEEVEVIVPLRIYNKALQLATRMPESSAEAKSASQAVLLVGPRLEVMNHSVEPKPFEGATSVSKSTLLGAPSLLARSTLFFAITHGTPSGIYDSFEGPTPPPPPMTWAEIRSAVSSRESGTPGHNVVFLAACETAGPWWAQDTAIAFGISPNAIDRVFAGFPRPLSASAGSSSPIEKWCECLFMRLAEGWTFEVASRLASDPVSVKSTSGAPMTPVLVGDPSTTLISAYGRSNRTQWYRIFRLPH